MAAYRCVSLLAFGLLVSGCSHETNSSASLATNATSPSIVRSVALKPVIRDGGSVWVSNKSNQTLKLSSRYWIDDQGQQVSRRINWIIEPSESQYLSSEGQDLFAKEFGYTLTNLYGSVDIVKKHDSGPKLSLEFTDAFLPKPAPPPAEPRIVVQSPEVKFEPKFEIARAAPARSCDVIIKWAQISETNHGKPWDESGPPDLKVKIERAGLFGDSYTTKTNHNVFSATLNDKAIRISEGDTLKITVYDADVVFDDEVGQYEKLITADTMNARNVDWSFGQARVQLEFQP